MSETKHEAWVRHLDGIGDELMRMAIACDVRLNDSATIERVIKNDETVCGRPNPEAFRKLRNLVMATYQSLNLAIDRIGSEDTKLITAAIVERIDKLRTLGGNNK